MMLNRLISVAPMMDYTDRHDRYFLRLISPHALLYTEMITTGALIYGDTKRFLEFHPLEHPLALQVGGSDPQKLAQSALLAKEFNYDEINLNVGCPSDRVKSGHFGACLMLNPSLVAECVSAMTEQVSMPVTVKCRIGVDEYDSYDHLCQFIAKIARAGCKIFIIHARKAWLKGLSPKQNREIPPLCYDIVYRIKQDFPQLTVILNGGIKTTSAISAHLSRVDGVMIGREAYSNPYFLAEVENLFFEQTENSPTRQQIIEKMLPYIELQLKNNIKLSNITRHLLGLFQNQPGARSWRRYLSENAYKPGVGIDIIKEAMRYV